MTQLPQSPASPPPTPGYSPTPSALHGLQHVMIVLRSHLLVAVALTLVACTLVAWMQMRQPKRYTAQSMLFLERPERRIDLGGDADYYQSDVALITRLEQIRSIEVAQRVAESFTPEETAIVTGTPREGAGPAVNRALEQMVRGSVSFDRPRNTLLIAIKAVHRDPKGAALLANRYAEQFIRYIFDRSNASNDTSLGYLREQAEELRKRAESAERELQEYRQRYNLVSLEANQNIIVDNLKSLNASATAARVARGAIEARLAQAEAIVARGDDAAQLASIAESQSLEDLSERIADLRAKRAVMAERYGRRHPAMEDNERSMAALEKSRDDQTKSVLASLRDHRERALAEERQLTEQLANAEKQALALDQLGVEYSILRRTVESHKAIYAQTLSRLNDATMSAQLRGVNIKISALASPPGTPSSPNVQNTLLITVAVGLVIFFGYPLGAEMFFGRVRSSFDVEYHLGAEVLGEIGSVRKIREAERPILVRSEQDENALEQFRAFYAQLKLNSRLDVPKTILVTSALPGEGKSFIAANLAGCFVTHGHKTLLVDVDLRRPKQHRHFNLPSNNGIIRWLDAGGSLEGDLLANEHLKITEVYPGLHLLCAGGLSRKATELMEGGRLHGLLTALQARFDVVIVDTPPAGIFPDAVAFAKACHELVFVCRFNAASRTVVRDTVQRLLQSEVEFPGIVLNGMPTGVGTGYYYKSYGYNRAKYYGKHADS